MNPREMLLLFLLISLRRSGRIAVHFLRWRYERANGP